MPIYTPPTLTGYNATPPTDAGAVAEENKVKWATYKDKLHDPVITQVNAINANALTIFTKLLFNGITNVTANYPITTGDIGKVQSVNGAFTVNLIAIASVSGFEYFSHIVFNAGTSQVILNGNGTETIDGVGAAYETLNLRPGEYAIVYLAGSIWRTIKGFSTDIIYANFQNHGDYSGNLSEGQLIWPWSAPTKLADPATLPTGVGLGCAFSPNGEFLAVAHDITPFITIYQRSGTTFNKLTNPATLPTGAGYSCAFSANGEFLAVAHDITPFITIYQTTKNMPENGILYAEGFIA